MEILANLPVSGQSGWEKLCRGLLVALDKLGVTVQLVPKTIWNQERVKVDNEDASRLTRMIQQRVSVDRCSAVLLHQFPDPEFLRSPWMQAKHIKKFCYTSFETDRCPQPWIESLNRMDGVWVLSEFNKEYWTKSGIKNIEVLPFGMDTQLYSPGAKPIKVKGRKKFAFIANGDYTERKNFEGLIEAFVTEFSRNEDVCLIIKAHAGGFVRRYQLDVLNRLRQDVVRFNKESPPRVLLISDKVSEDSMPGFYTAGDCFVLATRGEGLGIPFAEAMACGVPVIAPRWGGQLDFLNDGNSYLVDVEIKQIDDMEYIRKCLHALNHSWAYPSIDTLRRYMRFVYEFKDQAKEKALVGRAELESRSWQRSALWVVNRCRGTVDDVISRVLEQQPVEAK